MTKFIPFVFALLLFSEVDAQSPLKTCPSDEKNNALLQTNPTFNRSFQSMERILRERESNTITDRVDEVYIIPVVVHVIHLGEPIGTGSNISDAQINSAIAALNEDFRHEPGTNGFGSGVDVEIEFCLASRNPQNQPTTGINRVNGSSVTNYSTQGITANGSIGASELNVKALSTWPRDSYMNVWVVTEIENNNGGAGIQGYAYFPINDPRDGIVVQYKAFGTTGTLNSFTNLNRTLTHEVGHYLNLYHTFENTSSCSASESNCNNVGDRVCDTPPTIQNSSCTTPTCAAANFNNYMDYTPEGCQNMYTAGQRLRMRTALEVQRGSLLNSLGCLPVNSLDVGVTAINEPTNSVCSGSVMPVVSVLNFGSETINNLLLNYSLNGGALSTYQWSGTLVSGATTSISLPSISPAIGEQNLVVFTSNPNGNADQNTTNDAATSSFTVVSGSSASISITLDQFGSETTWNVTDALGGVVASGGPYQNGSQGTVISEQLCLASNCNVACPGGSGSGCVYTLNAFDAFGDGQGFTSGSISVTTSSGVLTFSNNWGPTESGQFCVSPPASGNTSPIANFNIQDNSVCPGTQVDFTSTSTNSPTTYSWIFEGGIPATSSASNPQNIVWNTPGTFDITLTVSNSSGSDTYVCTNCMTVYSNPTVSLVGTNPACNGQSSGSINSTPVGTGPFTYLWSNNSTTQNITNVAAGSYTVAVTDGVGCSVIGSATLQNPALLTVTASTVNPTCSNTNNGSITTTVTGGTGNKTYLWNTAAVTSSLSDLLAGTYSVVVTDSRGCTASANSIVLTAPSPIVLNYSVSNISCPLNAGGTNSGIISGSASGGTGAISYLWTPGNATTATISNLAAGSYTLTASDGAGCIKTQTYNVTIPSPIVITGVVSNPNCPSDSGSITVNASGGTGNKSLLWSNGVIGNTLEGNPGQYSVTATDGNNCQFSQTFQISSPALLTLNGVLQEPSCNGFSDGSIVVSLPGAVGAVSFEWVDGVSGSSRSNLPAGIYSVIASYGIGCEINQSFVLNEPEELEINLISSTNPACNAGNTGSLMIAASGGSLPYDYSWSDGSDVAERNNLTAGSYELILTDANLCVESASYFLQDPAALVVSGNITNAQCGEANGGISVSIENTVGPVVYAWAQQGLTGSELTGLEAGTYSLEVTDSLGCTASESFSVQTPSSITIEANIEEASCSDAGNGAVQINVTGGTPPFLYSWYNEGSLIFGENDNSLSNLEPGTYIVTILDDEQCLKVDTFVVDYLYEVSLLVTSNNPLCSYSADGNAEVTMIGGVGDIDYEWSNGVQQSFTDALAANTEYTVLATDSNGCMAEASIILFSPSPINVTSLLIAPNCSGLNNGSVFATVSGGNSPYSYLWDNGFEMESLESVSEINNLAPGLYELTVIDSNGCEAVNSFELIAPLLLTVQDTISPISCHNGSDGDISVEIEGGSGFFDVIWENVESGAVVGNTLHIDSLIAGTYELTIFDSNNCGIQRQYVLTNPLPLQIFLVESDPLCFEGSNGLVVASVLGNQGEVTYQWSTGDATNVLENLSAGFYSLEVTDSMGCESSAILELTDPSEITISLSVLDALCDGSTLGSISAEVYGGTGVLMYEWSDISGADLIRSNLSAGSYSLSVQDENGCQAVESVIVYALSGAQIELITIQNPSCFGEATGEIEVSIIGGLDPQEISWLFNGNTVEAYDSTFQSNLSAGTYRIIASDTLGCSAYTDVTLVDPDPIEINIAVTSPISCYGESDGVLSASATGGTGEFVFIWNDFDTTSSYGNLATGDYHLLVTDVSGCSESSTVTLTQPDSIVALANGVSPSCFNDSDGAASLSAVGGSAPYTYSWQGVLDDSEIDGLTAGIYSFEVADMNGCIGIGIVEISNPDSLTVAVSVGDVSCNGLNNGTVNLEVNGGTAPYEYNWYYLGELLSEQGASISNVFAGNYILDITDANECLKQQSIFVGEPEILLVNPLLSDASCTQPLGSASVTVQGGTAPYVFSWSQLEIEISNSDSIDGLQAGNYSLLVQDNNSCSVLYEFEISEVIQLLVDLTASDISCFGQVDGAIFSEVLNGLPPYSYEWSNNDSNPNITGLEEGEYSVLVTDDNGCTASDTISLTEPTPLDGIIDSVANVSCYGGNNGYASVNVSGGTAPYFFSWNGLPGEAIETDLLADTFIVIVSDNNGCELSLSNIQITEPNVLEAVVEYQDQSCVATNGSITLTIDGGTTPYDVQWNQGLFGEVITDISAGSYSAIITDANGCELEVSQVVSTYCYETQLIEELCSNPPVSVSLYDNLQCVFVNGATSYTWSLYANGSILGEVTTPSNLLAVNDIPGVFQGAQLGIEIAVLVDGLVYPADNSCFISIAHLPITQLVSEDCNAVVSDTAYVLDCTPMQEAAAYSWFISGAGLQDTIETSNSSIAINDIPGLIANQSYTISLSYETTDGFVSQQGQPCTFIVQLNTDTVVNVLEMNDPSDFIIYPNPGSGEELSITDIEGADFCVYDACGRLLHSLGENYSLVGGNRLYTLPNKLSSGLYYVGYSNGKLKKWIVQ